MVCHGIVWHGMLIEKACTGHFGRQFCQFVLSLRCIHLMQNSRHQTEHVKYHNSVLILFWELDHASSMQHDTKMGRQKSLWI